jgi:uncharacterized protein (DUF1015 family)
LKNTIPSFKRICENIAMVKIKAFKGIRPKKGLEQKIISRPYDVLNSEEAREEAKGNEMSLYHIIKPEIDFPGGTDEHLPEIYEAGLNNFLKFQQNGWLLKDSQELLYIYSQTMNNKTQYGLVATASIDDYANNLIKKHELTRKDKEQDRVLHTKTTNANIEPVFLSYPSNSKINAIISEQIKNTPEYDITTDDNIRHTFWLIEDNTTITNIIEIFSKISFAYIADGHHRSAAGSISGFEKRKENPNYTGNESFNYFLAVFFPDEQLQIFDYNRVVKDLNGLTTEEFLKEIEKTFTIEKKGNNPYSPEKEHTLGLYLENCWHKLSLKNQSFSEDDVINSLDANILTKNILEPILGIHDLRTDKRIDFVGGIRGLKELEKRVNSGEMKIAFSMYPVSMKQIMAVSDNDLIMPPKTTWFEPKLRSGLIIHSLND